MFTTPGPLTPTFMTVSGCNTMESAGHKDYQVRITENNQFCTANSITVRKIAAIFDYTAHFRTVSIIPYLVEPTLTEEQTISVTAKASGIEQIRFLSPLV